MSIVKKYGVSVKFEVLSIDVVKDVSEAELKQLYVEISKFGEALSRELGKFESLNVSCAHPVVKEAAFSSWTAEILRYAASKQLFSSNMVMSDLEISASHVKKVLLFMVKSGKLTRVWVPADRCYKYSLPKVSSMPLVGAVVSEHIANKREKIHAILEFAREHAVFDSVAVAEACHLRRKYAQVLLDFMSRNKMLTCSETRNSGVNGRAWRYSLTSIIDAVETDESAKLRREIVEHNKKMVKMRADSR